MNDEGFMREALKVSEQSIKSGNSPFAAVVVDTKGKVIGKGHNTVVTDIDPTCHAEINAIRMAAKKIKNRHLTGCTIYSTNEPCPMCFSAIHWARMKRLVYGQPGKFAAKYGFLEDISAVRKRTHLLETKGVLKLEVAKLFEKWKKGKHVMY